MCKLKIKKDLYNIANRIKSYDKGYFIIFDIKKQRYEIHNSKQINDTYCLSVPYDELDKRTLDLVLKTRRENFEKLIEEMEISNKKMNDLENQKIIEKSKYDFKQKLKKYS